MKNEIEAQFLDINKNQLRAKLQQIDAKLEKPETLMRRTVFSINKHAYARVRDEGDKVTMTYKNISDSHSIVGTKEINLEVSDYDDAVLFLKNCGLKARAVQETKREIWSLGKTAEITICIDTWPWLPTFVEIEAATENQVWETAAKLGLKKSQAKFGPVDTTYQHYYGIEPDVINLHTPEISFESQPPKWATPTAS